MTKPPIKPLTKQELRFQAPAAFATEKAVGLSDRYTFISTENVIDQMADLGWYAVSAYQNRSKRIKDPMHTTHMVTFQQPMDNIEVGGVTPQIVSINNHQGRKSHDLFGGFIKWLCLNGLVVSTGVADSESYQIHRGDIHMELKLSLEKATGTISKALEQIDQWRGIELQELDAMHFASRALTLRNPNKLGDYRPLLQSRRQEDERRDLWTVFNVVQENLIQGGVSGVFNRRRIRHIAGVDSRQRINQGLWGLAEETARNLS